MLKGLDPAQAKQAAAAGAEAFVYALGHAMSVSGFVALLGAGIGVTAIRAKRKSDGAAATEVAAGRGGSALTARESA